MSKKLFVFDADGTLFDSDYSLYLVWLEIGKQCNKDTFQSFEHYKSILKNKSWPGFMSEIGFDSKDDLKRSTEIYCDIASKIYLLNAEWFDGVPQVLEAIENDGHEIAIATNALRKNFKHFFNSIDKDYPIFDGVSHKGMMKPRPDMIIDHMRDLGFDAANTFMIGDDKVDMLAGNEAGVKTVWAKYGSSYTEEKLGECKKDYTLGDISQLFKVYK